MAKRINYVAVEMQNAYNCSIIEKGLPLTWYQLRDRELALFLYSNLHRPTYAVAFGLRKKGVSVGVNGWKSV